MENHSFIPRISRLLSSSLSSCRFRSLPDVADSSMSMQTNCNNNFIIPHENDSFENDGFSGPNPCRKKKVINVYNRSSSSHSGWFSSADEKFPENDAFLSFSSCSGDSFRLRDRRPKVRCDEMKSIDEIGEHTSSSILSACVPPNPSDDTVTGSRCSMQPPLPPPPPQTTNNIFHEKNRDMGSDQMSARIYYSGFSRRKETRTRRRNQIRKSLNGGSMAGDCLAVEKKSRDPRGDFKASMVDMILAKHMFGAEDLERLLMCFLSLNSVRYHSLIIEVFSEICETLFRF